jgi:hypothetical protein
MTSDNARDVVLRLLARGAARALLHKANRRRPKEEKMNSDSNEVALFLRSAGLTEQQIAALKAKGLLKLEAWVASGVEESDLPDLKEWIATADLPKPVSPEQLDYLSDDFAEAIPAAQHAERFRAAQARYIIRKFKEARERGWRPTG